MDPMSPLHVCMCVRECECVKSTCAAELLALDLTDALVGEAARVAAARPARLYGVVKQVVSQPLQVTVTHKGILSKMSEEVKSVRGKKCDTEEEESGERGIKKNKLNMI